MQTHLITNINIESWNLFRVKRSGFSWDFCTISKHSDLYRWREILRGLWEKEALSICANFFAFPDQVFFQLVIQTQYLYPKLLLLSNSPVGKQGGWRPSLGQFMRCRDPAPFYCFSLSWIISQWKRRCSDGDWNKMY